MRRAEDVSMAPSRGAIAQATTILLGVRLAGHLEPFVLQGATATSSGM